MFSYLNIEQWSRKNAFNFYKDFDDPFFNVTVNLDVTALKNYCKKNDLSFFLACLHRCLEATNEVENFRMRMDEKGIKVYDIIHGGSTLFYEDESFGFAYYDFQEDLRNFIEESQRRIDESNASKSFDPSNEREDLIYFSSLPWIRFTSLKHAMDKRINPSIPRISFGKYFEQNTTIQMPVNVEVNHALMDGFQMARFLDLFQNKLYL